jgi:hypothetical protein
MAVSHHASTHDFHESGALTFSGEVPPYIPELRLPGKDDIPDSERPALEALRGRVTPEGALHLRWSPRLLALPEGFGALAAAVCLRELHLTECVQLAALPEELGLAAELRALHLGGCASLVRLPDGLCNCARLETLWLHGCRGLTALPDVLGRLAALRTLELSHCARLEALPASLGDCADLERLLVGGCAALTGLPWELGRLSCHAVPAGRLTFLLGVGECPGLAALHGAARSGAAAVLAQLAEQAPPPAPPPAPTPSRIPAHATQAGHLADAARKAQGMGVEAARVAAALAAAEPAEALAVLLAAALRPYQTRAVLVANALGGRGWAGVDPSSVVVAHVAADAAAAGDVSYRVHAPGVEPVALHLWLGKDAAARMLRAPLLETRLAQGDDWCIEEWPPAATGW